MSAKDPFLRLMEETRGLSSDEFVRMIEGGRPIRARDLVSIQDLAAELGVSVRTLRRWNKLPDAPKRYRQSRRLMYRRAHVQHWVERWKGTPGAGTTAGVMGPLEMPSPGTTVYRETADALNTLRSGTSGKLPPEENVPALSDADAAAIREIARRHKQCTDRLHRIAQGKSKSKFEHTRGVYLESFATRVCATVRALAKTRGRATLEDIAQFAEELDVWEPLSEPVRVMLLPKSKGGYRGITMHGPRRMAQQFIVRDVLTAVGLDNEHDYCRRGAGGEKAMIRDACQRIEDEYWHWQVVDVVKCFASLKPGHLSWLPLPKELIRNVVFLPKCAKLEVIKKYATSWGDSLLYPSDTLTIETVRRGLPQGSVLSPLVARVSGTRAPSGARKE